ncbi:hypothetical protein [Agromyces humi]|uniref:hypothetical protein n=1 Tax=Agromyces humi TaxID=1766800 RepID=UPI001359D9E5|nr:hypothetical protein [Agromyces humi]
MTASTPKARAIELGYNAGWRCSERGGYSLSNAWTSNGPEENRDIYHRKGGKGSGDAFLDGYLDHAAEHERGQSLPRLLATVTARVHSAGAADAVYTSWPMPYPDAMAAAAKIPCSWIEEV